MENTKNHIKDTLVLPFELSQGSLIDFETTGIPGKDEQHEVVTLGFFQGNKAVIIQRKTKSKKLFYDEIRQILQKLPKPFYSYNSKFERAIINKELGLKFKESAFIDLMRPWRELAEELGIKWPKLDDLISEPEDYFGKNKISGKDVPELWKAYLSSGEKQLLEMIMNHCLSDILREMILLIRYHQNAHMRSKLFV